MILSREQLDAMAERFTSASEGELSRNFLVLLASHAALEKRVGELEGALTGLLDDFELACTTPVDPAKCEGHRRAKALIGGAT